MVSSATFRLPGPLAITVATVDAMSGGRVELGLGSGWFGGEHTSYGIPFPPVGERFDLLEEQLAIVTGLWATPPGETLLVQRRALLAGRQPGAAQAGAVAAAGDHRRQGQATRTPALAARFAAEYNVPFDTLEVIGACFDRARRACEAAGRDPATLVLSAAQTLAVGADEARGTPAGRGRGRRRRRRCGRTAWAAPRPRSSTSSAGWPSSARAGSTCR